MKPVAKVLHLYKIVMSFSLQIEILTEGTSNFRPGESGKFYLHLRINEKSLTLV